MLRIIIVIFLIASSNLCYSRITKRQISRISFEVINDLLHSTDFTPQKITLAENKKIWKHKKFPDSVDTSITKKFRISFWGTQLDTIFISTSIESRYIQKLTKVDEYFDSKDLKFMNEQINSKIKFKWDKSITGVRIIHHKKISKLFKKYGIDKGWKVFYSKYYNAYYNFSRPIFNRDFTKGIIEIGLHCGGLCGSGGVYLIEKQNGTWNMTRIYSVIWTS